MSTGDCLFTLGWKRSHESRLDPPETAFYFLFFILVFDLNRGKKDTVETLWTVHIQNVAPRQTLATY